MQAHHRSRSSSVLHDACRRVGAVLFALITSALIATPALAHIITEFHTGITSGATPQGICAGPDGNVWFTERFGDRIGRITPTGTVNEFTSIMTSGAQPANIVLGSDGALWFTEAGHNKIGRIDATTGVITEFSIPPPAGQPYGIALGSDNNIWFTAVTTTGGAIGQILTLAPHTVTIFNTGISDPSVYSITPGPDGNLWFTEPLSAKIGQITTAGVVHEFSATGFSTGNNLGVITAGPDGNLWFTSFGDQAVGRITTSGVVTKFTAGIGANSFPVGIAAGPDGRLWFTEGNSIGRFDLGTLTTTEYSSGITPGASGTFITAGPDGNMWFTEDLDDIVARITIPAAPPPVLQSAVSRKQHSDATWDLPLTLVAPPGVNHSQATEPRIGPSQMIVLTFDKPIAAATVAITEGVATAGAPTFSGNDVIVALTGVTNGQYVTVSLTNVASTDGGVGGVGEVRVGYLLGDVNQTRVVSVADLGLINAQLSQPVTATNFLKDINAGGTLTLADKGIANANLTKALPTP